MLRFLFVLLALVMLFSVVVAFVVSVLIVLAVGAAVGIPLWLLVRQVTRDRGITARPAGPIERLRAMYLDGGIDLPEFEQLVARYIAVER